TRSYGDWSSDVCSSDLATSLLRPRQGHTLVAWALLVRRAYGDLAPAISVGPDCPRGADRRVSLRTHREHAHGRGNRAEARAAARSEERRVGKECRARRW